jgi:hypothetical protein
MRNNRIKIKDEPGWIYKKVAIDDYDRRPCNAFNATHI